MALDVEIKQSLAEIDPDQWNDLGEADYPFTRHQFLFSLEQHHCLIEFGWQPVYITLREQEKLIAAVPCYIKYNSYGELVFDHSWAQAYQRSGQDYYPKLVTAIPYTPATGPRFLVDRDIVDPDRRHQLIGSLIQVIQQFCISNKLSGWHCLFERETLIGSFQDLSLDYRFDCQYHWHNQGYRNFDDFLAALNSRKRKNIRRERASVAKQQLIIERKPGNEITEAEWLRVYDLYSGIFLRKYGTPTLSRSFFKSLGETMQQRVMVVWARNDREIIAASLFFISDSTLFGRVWGCDEYYNHLHFECCYYQGIEYCIEQGLDTFDPGAQGEHKISRGFLPTRTCSAHWFADSGFQEMIKRYLEQEKHQMQAYCEELSKRSPYKRDNAQ